MAFSLLQSYKSNTRLQHLDGLRGLAILLVIFYHAYVRWSEIVPWGEAYTEVPLLKNGNLGVQLFFMISGFVILMTLEKCKNIFEFLKRRWYRLFPAMLFCTIVIFATASFFPERPAGEPHLWYLLPGLTFTEPEIWMKICDYPWIFPLEGAFWSLYVEFKFYIFAGLVYFLISKKNMTLYLLVPFAIGTAILYLPEEFKHTENLTYYSNLLSLKHFGWFAAGTALYQFTKENDRKWLIIGSVIAVICSTIYWEWERTITATAISFLFIFSNTSKKLQNLLSSKSLLFYGFISYPLYLCHENTMIATAIKLGKYEWMPHIIIPLIPILLLSAFAYLTATFVEGNIRNYLRLFFQLPLKLKTIINRQ